MINFKVYAGNMFCGYLAVLDGFSHNYLSRSNNVICKYSAIDKIASYKRLKLVRVKKCTK